MGKKKYYYAVRRGRITGVYDNYEDALAQTHGYSCSDMKKFKSSDEAWAYVRKPIYYFIPDEDYDSSNDILNEGDDYDCYDLADLIL